MGFWLRVLLTALLCGTTAAFAGDPPMLANDPQRPVEAVSRELNIAPAQFVACFNEVHPMPGGQRPESGARVSANKQVLLPCLQKANPAITNEKLDEVMDKYRPGGHAAQAPQDE